MNCELFYGFLGEKSKHFLERERRERGDFVYLNSSISELPPYALHALHALYHPHYPSIWEEVGKVAWSFDFFDFFDNGKLVYIDLSQI